MPEVSHTATVAAPLEAVWAFTRELNNWARYVTGYESHIETSDTESTWTLKGDLGGLTRVVDLQVYITAWNDLEGVEFTLQGVNEPVAGSGAFRLRDYSADQRPTESSRGWLGNLGNAVRQWLYRLIFRGRHIARSENAGPPQSEISFELTLNAGGQAGPMLNVLMAPMLEPAARNLATQIAAHVEQLQRKTP